MNTYDRVGIMSNRATSCSEELKTKQVSIKADLNISCTEIWDFRSEENHI